MCVQKVDPFLTLIFLMYSVTVATSKLNNFFENFPKIANRNDLVVRTVILISLNTHFNTKNF